MSFLTGTEPAGFGCSMSRTGRKVGRRSLYTSLLPTASASGCRSNSGLTTSTGGNGHSAEGEDFEALQREDLLRLYLEEPDTDSPGHGWGALFFQQLLDHLCTLKERTVAFATVLKKRIARHPTFLSSHGKHKTDEERHGEIGRSQGVKERKTTLHTNEGARTTSRRFWKRVLAGKWNGTFVLLPLIAACVLLFALVLLWLHAESGDEVPGAPVLLHTVRSAADASFGMIQDDLLQREKSSEKPHHHSRQGEERETHAGLRHPSSALRTKRSDHSGVEIQNEGSGDLKRIPLRRWKKSVQNDGTGAATHSPLTAEMLNYLMLALAQHEGKLPLVEAGAPEATTRLQTDLIIRDFMNSQYIVELGVGTPPQTVRAIADTGSSDFWACSEKCGIFCMLHKVYNHGKSSTYVADNSPYNITYVGGPVSGFLSVDNVYMGDLKAERVLFAEADNVKGLGPAFFFGHFDGLLGMGLPATATHGLKPMMQTAIEQQLLKKWVFAFYLSSDDTVDGELTLGGYDPSRIGGPIVYSALIDKRYWMIDSQGMRVKENIISKTTRVIIDSGTTLVAGPLDEVDHIARMFGAFSVPMIPKGTYLISCDEALILEDIEVMIEGNKFTLSAKDLVIKVSDIKGVPCLFGMIGLEILEGKARHKAPHHRKASAGERENYDMLQQLATARQGSLLARLLVEERLINAGDPQAHHHYGTQGNSDSGGSATFSPEANPATSPVQAVSDRNDEVSESERLAGIGRLWILGDVFMRGVYTIFDYEGRRIGFAKLRDKNAK